MLEAAALLDTAVALFKRFRWLLPAVPFMALSAFLALKLYGFLWWDGALDTVARQAATIAQIEHASKANEQAQREQVAKLEAKYTEQAKEAQASYDKAIANARPAVVRYIDSHRLHEDRLCVSTANPTGQAPDPGLPANLPSDTGMVAIRTDHLQNLVDWALVGITAHNDAVAKIDDGTAEAVRAGVPKVEF